MAMVPVRAGRYRFVFSTIFERYESRLSCILDNQGCPKLKLSSIKDNTTVYETYPGPNPENKIIIR